MCDSLDYSASRMHASSLAKPCILTLTEGQARGDGANRAVSLEAGPPEQSTSNLLLQAVLQYMQVHGWEQLTLDTCDMT